MVSSVHNYRNLDPFHVTPSPTGSPEDSGSIASSAITQGSIQSQNTHTSHKGKPHSGSRHDYCVPSLPGDPYRVEEEDNSGDELSDILAPPPEPYIPSLPREPSIAEEKDDSGDELSDIPTPPPEQEDLYVVLNAEPNAYVSEQSSRPRLSGPRPVADSRSEKITASSNHPAIQIGRSSFF